MSEPSIAPRSPIGHSATEDHTNKHCTNHLQSAGINCTDLLLRPGLTRRPPPNNQKARINLKFKTNQQQQQFKNKPYPNVNCETQLSELSIKKKNT